MRSTVLGARSCLVAFLCFSLLNLPAMAATAKPLGMVVLAENARLDNANAIKGTDLYSGDVLSTDQSGSLRLKVGASQVYLLSLTSAVLAQEGATVRAKLDHGTLGFSTVAADQLSVETPLGIVRSADGQHVLGQVMVLSSKQIEVSAFEGTLVVDSDGQLKTIEQGATYTATLAADSDAAGAQGPTGAVKPGINWKRVAVVAFFVGGTATIAAILWVEATESCTVPPCN